MSEQRLDYKFSWDWRLTISDSIKPKEFSEWGFMYDALSIADEIPRMTMLFRLERLGQLPAIHQQCSHSEPEPVIDNKLTCCLGSVCRECKYLKALEAGKLTPEQQDTAKAYTCAAHIVSKGGDVANEGYLLTTDNIMYWQRVYENLFALDNEGDEP